MAYEHRAATSTHIAEIFSPRASAMTDQARAPMTATPVQMIIERGLARRVPTAVAVTGILQTDRQGNCCLSLPDDLTLGARTSSTSSKLPRDGMVPETADYVRGCTPSAVSYTHLTLPTIYSV